VVAQFEILRAFSVVLRVASPVSVVKNAEEAFSTEDRGYTENHSEFQIDAQPAAALA